MAQTPEEAESRLALVTGATGYIGGRLTPRLLDEGWRVRVLTRDAANVANRPWADRVEIAEGDAGSAEDMTRASRDVEVVYYLLHSMEGGGDFAERDRDMARTVGAAARAAGVDRIVYLSGLHPDGQLSTHLASRVEVGQELLDSGVPTAVLQAAVVVGSGSASFEMLRHLTRRLPAMIAPKWLSNRIQPIAVRDVLHYLVAAAELDPGHSRTFDIGGPDVLTYREMIMRYAQISGLRRRLVITVPVLTPELASLWIGLVTPVPTGIARPAVGSLVHDVICQEQDLAGLVGEPEGGGMPFEDAVREALAGDHADPLPEAGSAPPGHLTAADPPWAGA